MAVATHRWSMAEAKAGLTVGSLAKQDIDMSKFPKLLVLGSSLPGRRDGGGVVRAEVLRRYPKDQYICFATQSPRDLAENGGLPEAVRDLPCRLGPLVPSLRLRGARFYMPLLRALGFHCVAPLRTLQAISFARQHGVELVWAELYGDAVVLAHAVSKGLNVPFVGTVWDDPEGWLQDGGYDWLSRRLLWQRFREALRAARNISTAGEAMQRSYEAEHGVGSVILRHGFDAPAVMAERQKKGDGIIIGFVGSTYGRDAWRAFLGAVASVNRSLKYASIKIRTFGASQFSYPHQGVQVEVRRWQPVDVMLREIAETDFCYIPYWFEAHKRRHVELSFPNKFETYLAAGRPVLFHGPAYAGIAEAVRQNAVGLCVHSLNERELVAALEEMIGNVQLRESFGRAAISAFRAEFNGLVMMRRFAELIGVDPALLG